MLIGLTLVGCSPSPTASLSPSSSEPFYAYPYLDPSLPTTDRVDDLLARMTPEEMFGQMTQVEEGSLAPGDVASLMLGSVLHGGGGIGSGTPEEWAAAVLSHQQEAVTGTRLRIPIIYGVDAVHGFGAMYGATVFPQEIGLGAANDPDLMTRIGHATAEEMSAVGVRWDFAPVLAVPSDVRWGRTYESYSQDSTRVATLGAAYIEGLQTSNLTDPTSVIATAKHFVGDGSTVYGTSTQFIEVPYLLDQGVAPADESLLRGTLLPPYQAAISAGVATVMASFSSWEASKVHGQAALLTGVLRGDLGFTGFVVSDWAGCDQIDPGNYVASVAQCINAGVDMVMVPTDGRAFEDALASGVTSGAISMDRIEEAVRRILTVKFEMGLFENPYADPALQSTIGSTEHRAIAREAVQESLVLLQNKGVLPIAPDVTSIFIGGNAADDMGIQAGGWTMSWQGDSGPVIPGSTIRKAIEDRAGTDIYASDLLPETGTVDLCIAVVGEEPYAEGMGDSSDLALPGLDVLDTLEGRCGQTVLVIVSGRPVIITDAIGRADAVVAAWLPGTAGEGVADVLFGDVPFTGTLPMNWPRDLSQVPSAVNPTDYLFPLGFGLTD